MLRVAMLWMSRLEEVTAQMEEAAAADDGLPENMNAVYDIVHLCHGLSDSNHTACICVSADWGMSCRTVGTFIMAGNHCRVPR